MLQEMGIDFWGRPEAVTTAPLTPPTPAPARPGAAAPSPPAVAERRPSPTQTCAANTTGAAQALAIPALILHAARALYPAADPAQTPADLGAGWLIVTESLAPDPCDSANPLSGDSGRLLDNMLRAMQLHRHPRVFLAALERPGPGAPASADIPASLSDMVTALRPAMVLLLGHTAARVALGRSEPLGRLRAEPHQIASCPATVSYDPAFLLRSQDHKAPAWADLCQALASVRGAGV